jgi:mono/diheme cytochrome c family protein
LPTPFGAIYSTKITPDPETGIGRWSLPAFIRAMREGVDRQGRHLYPAFPYDHFTKVSDEDDAALYAFLMSREPVHAVAPKNELPFPLNLRLILAGWKLLFLHAGPYRQDASRSAEWNRGAYLVEGIGHCGACHTPRNWLGAEEARRPYAGGEAEGWSAYAIDASSPAPTPWDAEALDTYLRRGWHPAHGIALGPMAPVTDQLGAVPDSDVRAIATYVASLREGRPQGRQDEAGASSSLLGHPGADIYASACANCHEAGRPLPFGGIDLRLSSALGDTTPANLLNLILVGIPAKEGKIAPIMPGFTQTLNDVQIDALVRFLRTRLTRHPPWPELGKAISDAKANAVEAERRSDMMTDNRADSAATASR